MSQVAPPPGEPKTYADALARLLAAPTLPKLGLERMTALCAALGRPQDAFRSVHIAGTKGKGSTAAMTASIFRAAGMRVGLTTSPHLLCARERIIIDGELISEEAFVALEAEVDAAARTVAAEYEAPSFFERAIAMAFCAFRDAQVDIAVVEVGLGGRLDATNVISPLACAITRLGYDHMEFLGDTLRSIAGEKAGIIKRGLPVVSAPQEWEALDVIADVARRVGAHLIIAERCTSPSLIGLHQEENAGVAATLAWATGLITDEAIIRAGIAQVRWPGRYETACAAPLVIIDGAHDPLAMSALVRTVAQDVRVAQPPHLVIGASSGHDPVGLWEPLRGIAWSSFVCTAADHPRALPPLQVARAARVGAVDVVAAVDDAVRLALVRAQQDGAPVIITGSLFVVGEARALFFDMPRDSVHPRF